MNARPLVVVALLLGTALARAETICEVTAEEWSRPRSAAMVVALPGVRDCVARWQADPRQRLVIVHAAGEEGALWASELRDWLVANFPSAETLDRLRKLRVRYLLIHGVLLEPTAYEKISAELENHVQTGRLDLIYRDKNY